MRIVLDSSVLIAAHITRAGVCAELLEDVLMQHELITSQYILDEVARKLKEKFAFPVNAASNVIQFLLSQALQVEPQPIPEGVCRDPSDVPVLGTALAGNAQLLITVDKDLLALETFEKVLIVRPGDFWRRIA